MKRNQGRQHAERKRLDPKTVRDIGVWLVRGATAIILELLRRGFRL